MYEKIIPGAQIKGIECVCPTKEVDNYSFGEVLGEKYVKRNIKMTGIRKRRICKPSQTASDLCYLAANRLFDRIGWSKDDIGALIFVSQFPDYQSPSTAFVLQHRLGINKECIVFDVNLGCSGFAVGLQILASLLQGSNKKRGILLCGDTPSKPEGREVNGDSMLFGDSGSATAVEIGDNNEFSCACISEGDGFKAIYSPYSSFRYFGNNDNWRSELSALGDNTHAVGIGVMKGDVVFQFTMEDVVEMIEAYFNHTNTSPEDYDYFIFHQAQKLIIDNLAVNLDIPSDKVLTSLEQFGNTSVTSIPITMCYCKDKIKEIPRARILMAGYGIGLSCGIVSTELDTSVIGDIDFDDEDYKDWE